VKADFGQIKERISTLSGQIADPYDNFRLLSDLSAIYGHPLIYFALLGDFSRYDKNNTHRSRKFRELLAGLNQSAELGLHPSYKSFLHPQLFKKEKKRLEKIIKKPVTKSRFHFLRMKFPESLRMLLSENIKDDYSLGYSSMNGFRASTCTPFYFYDLEKEECTGLRMHPFIFMDSAMIDHLKITPEAAIVAINDLIKQVANYGGEAIGIWHNYSLSEKINIKDGVKCSSQFSKLSITDKVIKYLQRKHIDDTKWNNCVNHAFNGNLYGYAWFLDIVAGRGCTGGKRL
jgi:hypothetical protein